MHRFFKKDEDQIIENLIIVKNTDTLNHMVRSLRMTIGEACEYIYEGSVFECVVSSLDTDMAKLNIIDTIDISYESPIDITLFQCLPKGQKLELIIQKNVELGVKAFYLVDAKRCVTDFKHKDLSKKLARYNKIASEAAKQSKRTIIPEIEDLISVKEVALKADVYDLMIVLYEDEHEQTLKHVLKEEKYHKIGVIVGPEGGFDAQEINLLKESGCKIITLGNRILRTETAGMAAVACIQYAIGDLS